MRSEHPISLPSDSTGSMRLRMWLRLPWDLLAMTAGLAYWAFFGGLLTLIGGPLHLLLPRRPGEQLGRFLLHHLFRWFVTLLKWAGLVRVDSSGLEALGKSCGPLIAAPNHIALWDAVFIIARLPSAVCVMKKSILRNPVLGGGARLAGYIANDGTTRMIRNASKSLQNGSQLLLFPEGTRTKPDARWINPLKGGCAIIALRAQVPIYPLFIRSNTRFLEKGWPLWKRPVFPIHIRIDAGQPLYPGPGESAQSLTRRLELAFENELSQAHPLRRQSSGQAAHWVS